MAEVCMRLAFKDPCRAWPLLRPLVDDLRTSWHLTSTPIERFQQSKTSHTGVVFFTISQAGSEMIGLGTHYSIQLLNSRPTVSLTSANV